MEREEIHALEPGLYKVYWDDGVSLASVGILQDGKRWIACCNWTSPQNPTVSEDWENWKYASKFELIISQKDREKQEQEQKSTLIKKWSEKALIEQILKVNSNIEIDKDIRLLCRFVLNLNSRLSDLEKKI